MFVACKGRSASPPGNFLSGRVRVPAPPTLRSYLPDTIDLADQKEKQSAQNCGAC